MADDESALQILEIAERVGRIEGQLDDIKETLIRINESIREFMGHFDSTTFG